MKPFDTLQARWQAWWPARSPREQRIAVAAAVLVAVALLWWVALAPALRTAMTAPAAHAKLDLTLQQMTALQTQARALQAQPQATRGDALRALETSVRQSLGANAQLQAAGSGDAVNLQLRATPAEALAQWLGQARGNARAVPREAHLTRAQSATPAGAKPGEATRVQWDGTLVMTLPAR